MFSLKYLYLSQKSLLLPCVCEQFSKRGAVILKRKYPIKLHKKNEAPKPFRSTDYVYEVVKDELYDKKPNIDVILLSYVEGLGKAGDVVSVRPFAGYDKYILPGLAAYATPENIAKYSNLADASAHSTFSSKFSFKTLKLLSQRVMQVFVNDTNPWTLTKSHLRVAFRLNGYIVPESAIQMPERVISGPHKDQQRKEFYVTVYISETEPVKVRCRLYLTGINSDPVSAGDWLNECEPLFEEDREVLKTMPTVKQHPKYEKIRMQFNI